MVTNNKLFDPTAVAAAATTLYTSPANTKTVIKKLTFYNGSGGALNLTVNLVPSGGTAGATNVCKYKTLADKETFECFEAENQQLNAGDFISATGSGTGMVAQGSGLQIT